MTRSQIPYARATKKPAPSTQHPAHPANQSPPASSSVKSPFPSFLQQLFLPYAIGVSSIHHPALRSSTDGASLREGHHLSWSSPSLFGNIGFLTLLDALLRFAGHSRRDGGRGTSFFFSGGTSTNGTGNACALCVCLSCRLCCAVILVLSSLSL
jgi:hypothetical protein